MPITTPTHFTQSTAANGRSSLETTPWIKTMRGAKAIYWTTTGIVCSVMVFSAINFNLKNPFGPMKGAFVHLGFPSYFRIELTVAKALGVLALLLPSVPRKIKEFAYSGFAITLISASIAHFSVGDGILFVIDPLLFLVTLIVSYLYFEKIGSSARVWRRDSTGVRNAR
jgi:DoxX-like family